MFRSKYFCVSNVPRRILIPLVLGVVLLVSIHACVTPFEAEVPFAENSLSVQAYLSNISGDSKVILQRIAPYTVDALLIGEAKAQVWVSDLTGKRINFLEKERGVYFPIDPDFIAKSDEQYTLSFSTSDGQNYRSSTENMPVSIPISKVYYEPRYENRIVEGRIQTAWDVLLDTQDPVELGNYYRWDWVHYETTPFCDTYFGRGFGGGPDQLNGISCCQQPCYEKQACTQNCVNIGNDVLFNGKKLSRIPIQTIPHCVIEYYIEVQQRSINQGAYDYWKAVAQLSANTGGVFDIAPAAVRSNIRNLSEPNKKVYGYFEVSNVVEVGLFLNRIAPGPALLSCKPYPIPQPFGCAPCQGVNRSTIKPRYWIK